MQFYRLQVLLLGVEDALESGLEECQRKDGADLV
jgi:hypothetical protein